MKTIQAKEKIADAFSRFNRNEIDAERLSKILSVTLINHGEQYRIDNKDKDFVDSEGYELDQDGNRYSCCGDILDPDIMMCPSCKEHC